jgi:hypothetical protein
MSVWVSLTTTEDLDGDLTLRKSYLEAPHLARLYVLKDWISLLSNLYEQEHACLMNKLEATKRKSHEKTHRGGLHSSADSEPKL